MAQQPARPPSKQISRPDVPEAFADSVEGGIFDDGVVKITFTARRWKPGKTGESPVSEGVPTARLVLTTNACIALCNNLNQMMTMLAKTGAIKPNTPADRPTGSA